MGVTRAPGLLTPRASSTFSGHQGAQHPRGSPAWSNKIITVY